MYELSRGERCPVELAWVARQRRLLGILSSGQPAPRRSLRGVTLSAELWTMRASSSSAVRPSPEHSCASCATPCCARVGRGDDTSRGGGDGPRRGANGEECNEKLGSWRSLFAARLIHRCQTLTCGMLGGFADLSRLALVLGATGSFPLSSAWSSGGWASALVLRRFWRPLHACPGCGVRWHQQGWSSWLRR